MFPLIALGFSFFVHSPLSFFGLVCFLLFLVFFLGLHQGARGISAPDSLLTYAAKSTLGYMKQKESANTMSADLDVQPIAKRKNNQTDHGLASTTLLPSEFQDSTSDTSVVLYVPKMLKFRWQSGVSKVASGGFVFTFAPELPWCRSFFLRFCDRESEIPLNLEEKRRSSWVFKIKTVV